MSGSSDTTTYPTLVFRRPGQGAPQGVGYVPRIGRDYIPAMNAKLTIKAPFQRDPDSKAKLKAAGITNRTIPDRFSWTDPEQVKKTRLKDFDPSWILGPPNQSVCGSCWAVSSTSAHTDRFSISLGSKCPPLAAVPTASCATQESGGDGCQGGFPSDSGCFFEQFGTTEDSCWPYESFCSPKSQECSTSGAWACCQISTTDQKIKGGEQRVPCLDFGSRIGTRCGRTPGNPNQCLSKESKPKRYMALKNSTVSLAAGSLDEIVQRMKENVFGSGPVIGCYFVYGDFLLPTLFPQWGWKQTGGIYIHTAKSPYSEDPFVEQLFRQKDSQSGDAAVIRNSGIQFGSSIEEFRSNLDSYFQSLQGGHAVTVVGWDQADAGRFGRVQYWIVRNSWGPEWNERGFFRIAFQDPAKDINVYSNMEQFKDPSTGRVMGGSTAWEPDVSSAPSDRVQGTGTQGSTIPRLDPQRSLALSESPLLILLIASIPLIILLVIKLLNKNR